MKQKFKANAAAHLYLGMDKGTLCELRKETISGQDAIKYTFDNMSSDIKRYQDLMLQGLD